MPKTKSLTLAPDPRITSLKTRATNFLKHNLEIEVIDTPSFEEASLSLKTGVSIRKDLKDLLDPEIRAAKADLKAKQKVYKDIDEVILRAETALRLSLSLYAGRQREAQEKQVAAALSKGKDEKAAALAAQPFVPPVQGLSFTEHWHAEVENLALLVQAVVEGKADLQAVSPNMVYLNACAREAKEKLAIPGVKAVKETSSTVRS